MQTFLDQQNEVLRWIDEVSDQDITRDLVKDALNRSYKSVLGSRVWPFMKWPFEETITTVPGVRAYALKPGITRVLTLWDVDAQAWFPLVPRREWEAVSVNRTLETGTPAGAIYGDVWPVVVQPTSATTLTVVSTSASDTGSTLTVTGLNAAGDTVSETLSATGLTPVTSTTAWTFITALSKSSDWVGTLTLATTGGTTLVTLPAATMGKQYPTLEFIETPSAVKTYSYTGQLMPSPLVADGDIPATPYPYSELHVYDACLDLTAYNTELGAKEQRLWEARRTDLYNQLANSVDEAILGSRPRFVRTLEAQRRIILTA